MENIIFDSVRYEASIEAGEPDNLIAVIDGIEHHVPYDSGNTVYAEIQRQVAAGELTIQEAE